MFTKKPAWLNRIEENTGSVEGGRQAATAHRLTHEANEEQNRQRLEFEKSRARVCVIHIPIKLNGTWVCKTCGEAL